MEMEMVRIGVMFVVLVACNDPKTAPAPAKGVTPAAISVSSTSFGAGAAIPKDFTCDGADRSPQLSWSDPPASAKSIAIVVDDPDAPSGTFTHWLVYNLPTESSSLAEGVDPTSLGAKVGMNDFESVRYAGPCPPKMQIHRYRFIVYALDMPLELADAAPRNQVDTSMNGHVLAQGTLYGTFSH